MKALVVDDSKITRRLLAQLLAECGYGDVVAAGDGLEALRLLEEGAPFDLVVTDWRMPRMDGLAFLRQARREPFGRDVPFVVISSVSDDDAVAQLFAEGARSFIRKPFEPGAVRRALSAVARVTRLEREATAPALSGTLAGTGVVELTQFMALTRRTGVLHLGDPDASLQGRLDFEAGALIGARSGPLHGEEAFFALTTLAEGGFRLDPSTALAPKNVERPTTAVLFEALRRLDEQARAAAPAGRTA